ncbi:hypothetical protein Y032_0300g1801 [Ancylostoma ceylanicum]|nr:hypothetical protein Y032_0300g1801 [Ancylostoma ceylanicum]
MRSAWCGRKSSSITSHILLDMRAIYIRCVRLSHFRLSDEKNRQSYSAAPETHSFTACSFLSLRMYSAVVWESKHSRSCAVVEFPAAVKTGPVHNSEFSSKTMRTRKSFSVEEDTAGYCGLNNVKVQRFREEDDGVGSNS